MRKDAIRAAAAYRAAAAAPAVAAPAPSPPPAAILHPPAGCAYATRHALARATDQCAQGDGSIGAAGPAAAVMTDHVAVLRCKQLHAAPSTPAAL